MPRILGAILAGGKASRLAGINKALIETRPGLTNLQYLIRQMTQAGLTDIVILANAPIPYIEMGRTIVPDLHPGSGPLAGIEAALLHARQCGVDAIFTLPCDLPAITHRDIRKLIDAAASLAQPVYAITPRNRGHFACAVFPTGALPTATAAILSGKHSLERLHRQLHSKPVHFPSSAAFLNLNRPEDLLGWTSRYRRGIAGAIRLETAVPRRFLRFIPQTMPR